MMANGRATTRMHDERRWTPGAWLTLAVALSYLLSSFVVVLQGFQQPTDGWLYGAGLGANNILVANQSGRPSPLRPGDALLTIAGDEVAALTYRPLTAPAGWRVGGVARYTVQRDGATLALEVPLVTRPASALLAYLWGGGDGTPWQFFQTIGWLIIGFTVFLLRPGSTAARLLLLLVVYWGSYNSILSADTPATIGFYPHPLFWYRCGIELLWPLLFTMILHLTLAFPLPIWPLTRWPRRTLALLYGLPTAGVLLGVLFNSDAIALGTLFLTMALLVVVLLVTTVVRLRTVGDPVVRAQISWVAMGVCVPVLSAVLLQVALFLNLIGLDAAPAWIWSVLALALPLCLGIAISRYRLFDIEIIIRRTLVYSLLTLSLGAVYFASVVLLQRLFVQLTGEESTLAVVASTLSIAALFGPLRRRVQAFIDRRFFRRKYDAQLVLAQFAARAQQDADLDTLSADLLATVQETLEPEGARLWLVQARQASSDNPAKLA